MNFMYKPLPSVVNNYHSSMYNLSNSKFLIISTISIKNTYQSGNIRIVEIKDNVVVLFSSKVKFLSNPSHQNIPTNSNRQTFRTMEDNTSEWSLNP